MTDILPCPPLAFLRANGAMLEISTTSWQVIQGFAQHSDDAAEAGGVLLGRHLRDGSAIIVDDVTTPLRGDRRSRTRFHRSQRRHQAAIDRAWQESEGTCTYLGEWHTHPKPVPTPSSIDRADWQRRLQVDTFSEPLFFIIVGTVVTNVWEGWKDGRITPLNKSSLRPSARNPG